MVYVGRGWEDTTAMPSLSHIIYAALADEAWEIDKSQLSLGRELGSGQFGVSSDICAL